MVLISTDSLAALAAHASASLDLIELGVVDKNVVSGLKEGEEFCQYVEVGRSARASSERFSARSLAAAEFTTLVFAMPDGEELVQRVGEVRQQLDGLVRELLGGHTPDLGTVEILRGYFMSFAERLPYLEGIRDRLAKDLRGAHGV